MAWSKIRISAVAVAAMLLAPAAGAQDKIVWDIAIYGPPREVTAPIEFLAKRSGCQARIPFASPFSIREIILLKIGRPIILADCLR